MPNKLTKTELKTAFEQLKKHDVEAIVIDLRYWKFLQKDVKDDIACNQPLMYIIEAADATKMTILIHAETDNGPFTNILEMSTWEQKACELLDIWLRIYPGLKIGVLHVTTKSMVETICRLPEQVFGLITPQHLYLTFRNFVQHPGRHTAEMIPLPKFDADRETLQAVVAHPKLGKKFCYASDSFIHRHDRACQPLCSHVYTIPLAPHMTMEVFAKSFALQNAMEDFTVKNMQRKFPNLTRSAGTFGMKKEECYVRQDNLPAIPFLTGTKLLWSIA
jgi:dihydroorotase